MRHDPLIREDPLEQMKITIDSLQKHRVDICEALEYSHNSHTFNDVAARVIAGTVDTYVFPNSIIIMETQVNPCFSVYHGYIAAGDLDEIKAAQPMLERIARTKNCKYLSIAGRRGWERALRDQGWEHSLSIMTLEVPNGKD